MFFRWPWDGAATLLGPSGRPLAMSPAVQGAARDYGGGGAQAAAQGRKGCRRAERAGNQHHARLARYMERAARWLQHTGPSHGHRVPRRTGHRCSRRSEPRRQRSAESGARRGGDRNGPPAPRFHHHGNGRPALRTRRRAKNSRLLRWFQHAAETGTASSGARGGHRRPVYGERRKAATAAATAPGPPAPAHSNSGRARRAAAPSTQATAAPTEPRTADQTGNGGTNRAAHRGPDRQQKQRAWKDSLD
jgi:hypothetical protein